MMLFSKKAVFGSLIFLLALIIFGTSTAPYCQTASPWKSSYTSRPRLLWEPADWPVIIDRLTREPYITLYNRVKSRAGGSPGTPPQYYDSTHEYGQANTAKAAAFVWAVEGDSAYGEKSAVILEQLAVVFNYEDLAALIKLLDYDIHAAEAIQGYLAAFDILAGTGYLTGPRLTDIQTRLETMLVNCWNFYYVNWYIYKQVFTPTNHFTKLATAFGTAAITLNQSQHAGQWIDLAMGWGVDRVFGFCATDEGAYTEGPSYHVYAAVQHVPFFIQYNRFTSGEDATFYKRKCNLFGQNCTYESVYVEDPLFDPRFEKMAMWMLNIRLPNGLTPPIDDGLTIGNINGLISGALGNEYLAWDWLNSSAANLYSMYCSDLTVDMITTFDDTVIPAEPNWGPSVIYENDGYGIFRTDWSEDAAYALFLAEGGKARVNGIGHEHADNLSFFYWYDGKMLAIDPGYIKWSEHNKVRFGIDHNIISIDGKGPPAPNILGLGGVDAQIHQYEIEDSPQYAIGSTEYANTHWTRGFFFYDDFILVGDVLEADEIHEYEFLLHGNGGGDTGGAFTLFFDGAQWEIDGTSIDLLVTATSDITTDNYTDYHGWTWSSIHTHEVFTGSIFSQNAGFVASLIPDMDTSNVTATPLVTPDDCAGLQLSFSGMEDYLLVDSGSLGCQTTSGSTFEIINGAAWFSPATSKAVVFGQGASFSVDGRQIARQTNGISMKVNWGHGWVEITPDNGQDNELIVELDMPWADVSGSCVEQVRVTPAFVWMKLNGVCTVEIQYGVVGSDKFRINRPT